TASAYTALCMLRPKADEEELAYELRAASPSATPNRLIISYTDALLGRNGRMSRAIEKIGRGENAFEGKPFILRP
ncbi:MAG TPA: protein tyrosine phosphatase, partial [Aestuariivirga sp.]|nr:protein tyrosine phosphatase [Aestuariivirga sp.]